MVNGEVVKFNYPEFVADIYKYMGKVDNQNQASEGRRDTGKHDGVLPGLQDTSGAYMEITRSLLLQGNGNLPLLFLW